MNLVAPLSSGYADAPSGVARFYKLGTNFGTPATVFDVDGEALGTSITLDANGRKQGGCYVRERVQVRIETAAGALIDTFAVAHDDGGGTFESQGFTGTSGTNSQAAGGVVSQRTAHDKLFQSFGARDYRVLVTGSTAEQNLKDALNSLRATNFPFFNVKDSAYGAVGNGVSNDSGAIQAAIDAAEVSGGIVYLPAGIYLLGTVLTCNSDKVSFLGAGCNASILKSSVAGSVTLTVNDSSAVFCGAFIAHLGFDHSSTGSNFALQLVSSPGRFISNIRIRSHQRGIDIQTPVTILEGDVLQVTGSTIDLVEIAAGGAGTRILGGTYTNVVGNTRVFDVAGVDVLFMGAKITTPGAGSGGSTSYGISTASQRTKVIGCYFNKTTATVCDFPMYMTADVDFVEDSNTFMVTTFDGHVGQAAATYTNVKRGSRKGLAAASVSTTPTIAIDKELHVLTPTGNISAAVPRNAGRAVGDGFPSHGMRLVIHIVNNTGLAITFSLGANVAQNGAGTIANGQTRVWHLYYNGTLDRWYQIGPGPTDIA